MRRFVAVGVVGALIAAAPLIAGTATAADDTTKPELRLPKIASFVKDTTISAAPSYDGYVRETYDISMRAQWTATDASGICKYEQAQEQYQGGPKFWVDLGLQTSLTVATDDYVDQEGGGTFNVPAYAIRASDCAGNKRVKRVRVSPAVFQEDGQSYGYGTLPVHYAGMWQISYCECWSGGMTRKTSELNARADFRIETSRAMSVALVMETASNRGQALVDLNGKWRTIDTYSAQTVHRRVVWTGRLSSGTNYLSISNLATPGRPRIDIDAVMVADYRSLPES